MRYFKLLFLLLIFCCSNRDIDKSIYITGESKELIGKTIYLKTNNHFDFLNEDFELDSVKVDNEGKFAFKILLNEPLLVSINEYENNLPGTLKIFKENPELYQYLLCKNFLAYNPTLYLEPGNSYNIKSWKKEGELDDVIYDDTGHNLLRKYYYDSDYYDGVRNNRKIKDITIETAWENLNIIKTKLLNQYGIEKQQPINSFNHHL